MGLRHSTIVKKTDKENVHIETMLFSPNKEGIVAICYNTDESRGHYTKVIKPVTEGQILSDLTCMMYHE